MVKDNEYLKLIRDLISGKSKTTKPKKQKPKGIDYTFKNR